MLQRSVHQPISFSFEALWPTSCDTLVMDRQYLALPIIDRR